MRSLHNMNVCLNVNAYTTFKQRADFSPSGHASLTGVLTQCSLEEEYWDSTKEQEDEIRNEKHT